MPGLQETPPEHPEAAKFLIEQYKSLRDEITRVAGFHAMAVRYTLLFAVASFVFVANESSKGNQYYTGFIYAGTILGLAWLCRLITILDSATIESGQFIERLESELLQERASELGWQTFIRSKPDFMAKRRWQKIWFIAPAFAYGGGLTVYLYGKPIIAALCRMAT